MVFLLAAPVAERPADVAQAMTTTIHPRETADSDPERLAGSARLDPIGSTSG